MTPPASAAARSVHPGTRRAGRGAARHPRRVSGPARPSALAAAVALPAPGIALPRERPSRPSAPARSRPARPARRRAAEAPGLALRAIDAFDGLSGSTLFDRLIRGRLWIGLLAFSLIGIVAMQLLVLELNTQIGRTLQREALLQRQNAQMGIEDSASTAGDRIEPLAGSAGMVIAAPTALHFLGVGVSDVRRAAAVLATAVQAPGNSPLESTASASGGSQGTAGSTGPIASATAPVGESGSSVGAATAAGSGESGPGGGTQAGPQG